MRESIYVTIYTTEDLRTKLSLERKKSLSLWGRRNIHTTCLHCLLRRCIVTIDPPTEETSRLSCPK